MAVACACVMLAAPLMASGQSASPQVATVRGVVLDRADGSPIEDVTVRLQDDPATVKTDATGRFELTGVTPGRRTLYVSVVGFILVRRAIDVTPGASIDLTIVLSEGTGTYTETVNVTGERFREQEKSVPAQQTLGSSEIQNLRNLLTNDPMRAIQVLPGVTTGDDFRSEFSVRGSPFSRMNFTFDGVPTTFLLHTVQQVQDGGSIAMVNGDILDGITLMNGSYPQRYGNRLGAELDFQMREGSRDRAQTRIGVSGTDASLVVEGPLGKQKAGSWLVSARKSYLELLLRQITEGDDDFGFGFSDVQAKMVYDINARHRAEFSVVAGQSKLDQTSSPNAVGEVDDGTNRAGLVNGAWRFTPSSRLSVTNRVAFAVQRFENRNPVGVEIGQGSGHEFTWRTDLTTRPSATLNVDAGVQFQRQHREETKAFAIIDETLLTTRYDATSLLSSAFAHVRWEPGARPALSAGVRFDRWSLTDEGAVSPWFQAEARLRGRLKLRAGGGIYRQFPGFEEARGTFSPPPFLGSLRHERAYHADLGIEQGLGATARVQITVYNREERDVLRLPGTDPRVLDGAELLGPDVWKNTLEGYARGVELLVQRRSSSGLTGWLSYSFGVNRYRDRTTPASFDDDAFDGDFDQRHTFNAYGLYRLTTRMSVAGKLRMGSNTPMIGYWREQNGAYFVGSERNELRVPRYARLDVRANRTFNWEKKRLTLFVEVLNVLGRDNMRFETPSINPRTLQAFGILSSLIPRVPSAGILIEF